MGAAFSCRRLMTTLFLCGALPVLLCGSEFLQGQSYVTVLVCSALGFGFMLLCFVPFYVIRQKTGRGLAPLVSGSKSVLGTAAAAYYAAYFIIVAASLILRFTDMFVFAVNADASPVFMCLLVLSACAFAALRGINPVSRAGLFVFAIFLLGLAAIFAGSAGAFDFSANYEYIISDFSDFYSVLADCLSLAFLPAVFGFAAHRVSKVRPRQFVVMSAGAFVLVMLAFFFIYFVCGAYSEESPYSFALLSEAAEAGDMRGFDGLYTAVTSACLFAAVSVLLCCARDAAPTALKQSGLMLAASSLLVFVLCFCACSNAEFKAALTDSVFLTCLNIISATVIPSFYLFKLTRGKGESA